MPNTPAVGLVPYLISVYHLSRDDFDFNICKKTSDIEERVVAQRILKGAFLFESVSPFYFNGVEGGIEIDPGVFT